MRWPWKRQPTIDPKAHAAVVEAETKLSAQRRLQPEVDRLVARLDERRRQNRFAELIEDALRRQA